jgi:hypothetical protein
MDQHMKRSWLKITLLGVILIAGVACAKKSYIYLDYRLPTVTDRLQGRSLFVETHDLRRNREIFNPRAKEAFENFTGLFSLALIKSGDEQTLKGAYELPMLFEAALKERLDALGITIAGGQSANIPLFKINLNQFRINLVGQKWIADISYEVSLTQDNQTVSREVVTGSAERLKLIGSGGAEKVIGEIFTEMINRLNIERLFQQANL